MDNKPEITEAMLNAGLAAYCMDDGDIGRRETVADIYRAMVEASRTPEAPPRKRPDR